MNLKKKTPLFPTFYLILISGIKISLLKKKDDGEGTRGGVEGAGKKDGWDLKGDSDNR